ncbi:hypothetical protein ZIOFF_003944 [Zingiber officinale]|uniref:Uncharacterized protein n=1 Tax=Zingiber officinale TaxID=94328 RepID=A0A8J5LTV3_ZINOF|nr:hypothetical protein ZIOFF_003944 [Zingiber officinale]
MEVAGATLFLARSAPTSSWKQARSLCPAWTSRRKAVAMAMENNVAGGGSYAGVPNSNYVVSLDVVPSPLTRPLKEILRDLNKRVPDKIIDASHKSIPWYHTNRMLSFYAPGMAYSSLLTLIDFVTWTLELLPLCLSGWCGEVRNVIFSDNGTVTVVYRVTVRGSDGEAHRESSGTVSLNDAQFEDPVAAAEELAFCKACARYPVSDHLSQQELRNE